MFKPVFKLVPARFDIFRTVISIRIFVFLNMCTFYFNLKTILHK